MTDMPSEHADGQRRPDARGSVPAAETGGWKALRPELVITLIMVISTAAAAYGYAGFAAGFGTLTAWAVVILVLLRVLVPVTPAKSASHDEDSQLHSQASYIGFWRKRGVLVDASINMRSYDADLRPTLQHLLAARLAERHGVSLYADPEAARRLLLAGEPDDALWYWLDPARPAEQRSTRQGIPQRTLTAIIDRLERL
jgi:hypothetical protein